ncbi:MAG: MBOAT family O-acyltransferase [Candidatus Hydrogenedentes bacterium]|nr:MBOAT family O-acyltransferase [Candidatus Hydrogenedentota bacterium]
MVFSSHIFIFYFLPLVLFIYYLLRYSWRNPFLLVASYIFYGWTNPWFVLLMFTTTLINYVCGNIIDAAEGEPAKRYRALVFSLAASLGLLGFFKYANFLQANLNFLLDTTGAPLIPALEVILPAGISFYTFHCISYTVDIYRNEAKPVKRLADFACFVALYPQLIAGPIIRYHTIAEQLRSRAHSVEKFASGTALFILGFAKKVLIANEIGKAATAAFDAEAPTALDAWFGVTAYAFQIYFDFSAYSDMAVGLGRMIGFEFMKNFDAPYRSESITEFWRRWHISLSTFLRDYLYVPLGGNRHGPRRTYINLMIVMLLGGLWHGASWTFVAWGAFHGALLAWERWMGKESMYARLPRPVRIGMTFVLVLFSWVLFRSDTFGDAGRYFAAMFGALPFASGAPLLAAFLYTPANIAMMMLCAVLVLNPVQAHDWVERITLPRVILLLLIFTYALATMFVQSFNPFLYFQF